jgi:glycosyl transferase family 25
MACVSYIINLDRSVDRLDFMARQLQALQVPFERIRAIEGRNPSPEDRHSFAGEFAATTLGPAEIGCLLSHRKAWQAIAASGAPWGVVLEDDVLLSRDYPGFVNDLGWIPPDADLIKIEAQPHAKVNLSRPIARTGTRQLHRLKGSCMAAGAYAVSRRFCERQLERPFPTDLPADIYLFDPRSREFATTVTYVLKPAIAIQTLFLPADSRTPYMASVISPGRARDRHLPAAKPKRSARRNIPHAIRREFLRVVRQVRGLLARADIDKPVGFR